MTAAVAVASGVAAASPSGRVPGTAFADYGTRLTPQQSAGLARAARYPRTAQQATHDAVERQAARAMAARVAAARRAERRRAAARAAARADAQAASAQPQPVAAAQPSGSAQQIAMSMLGSFGWSASQFGCLDSLWGHESGWSVTATNPSTGAYGIPQALPGSKMASAGADWQTSAATQIRWGLGYIKQLYGSPCGAMSHESATGWY
ncbi:MAG: lytic transglycosylase domain-containing protein [Nocardiopsaceae bacterium]|nr:lytic transglycosylase domain-containing protein [Nocardiopsaceae bacterium]